MGARNDGGTARALDNGSWRAGGRRSRRNGGKVSVWDEAGDSESWRTGHAEGRGESSGRVGAAIGRVYVWGENKNQHQRKEAGYAGVLSGRPGASIAH
jgi:transcription elongation factor